MDAKPKTDKPARERVVDAANRLFYREGIRAVSVDAHGWFTTTATNHTLHEVCDRDKAIIATVMRAGAGGGYAPAAKAWDEIPCDIIHGPQGPGCPADLPPP